MLKILLTSSLVSLFGLTSSPLQAPIPPEALTMKELKPGELLVDPEFEAWDNAVNKVVEPEDMSQSEYLQFSNNLSLTELLFTDLKRLSKQAKRKQKSFVANVEKNLADSSYKDKLKNHILYPDMLNELIETGFLSKTAETALSAEIEAWPGHICPQKEVILRQLDKDDRETIPLDELTSMLKKIDRFNSKSFKKMALLDLMEMSDEAKHQDARRLLAEAIQSHPKLVADHPWVIEDKGTTQDNVTEEPHKSLFEATENAQRRRCNTAKKKLVNGIKNDSDKSNILQVSTAVSKVESCFRRTGRRARIRFLSRMKKYLEDQYGFPGEEIVLRRKALIYWSQDKFAKTREILNYLIEGAKTGNHQDILSRTLYTLARVNENEGKIELSIKNYQDFIESFPEDEKVNEAKTSMIMLNTITGNQPIALKYAREMVDTETAKAIDERDSATLSLALFWSGKLSLYMGERVRALEYWQRLSSEFYSTFYGAIGHYMLEALLGKRLVLQPVRVPRFEREKLLKVYSADEQRTVNRIEAMLKLGLKGEASCETKELGGEPDDHRKNLVKALYLYASGDWLEAIKKYVNLPRGLRHSLPRGMERLLFPKAYSQTIQQYAKKLQVDPDYVFAIIRQESVFNPNARSPVGAAGLMQLMPATARMEANSLRRDYVPGKRRQALMRQAKRKRIFEAETNLVLGIHHVYRLFKKYKNPIHVLTAYNANPSVTKKWMENIDSSDTLAYVERIPYRETRAYVKLVMRNYFYYKRWYSSTIDSPFMDFLAPKSVELAKAGIKPKEFTR